MSFLAAHLDYENDAKLLAPLCRMEHYFNVLTVVLLYFSFVIAAFMPLPITADVISRHVFVKSMEGVIEMETLGLVLLVFSAMPFVTMTATHIVIDLFFDRFSPLHQRRLEALSYALCACTALLFAGLSFLSGAEEIAYTLTLHIPESFFFQYVAFCLACTGIGMMFRFLHTARAMWAEKDAVGIIFALLTVAALFALPFIYKNSGTKLSSLSIGTICFWVMFVLLFLRIPIGFVMAAIGTLGLLCVMRTTSNAFSLVADIPYKETVNFVLVAVPMFMLMGEVMSVVGISKDMFDCFNKWLGRMPGGLACATVAGCAGFGAICGESLPTVIAMSTVALPEMRNKGYDSGLACGALASGGTLGILIPPSMGFVWYSIMTEESIGKLFVAGIIPGLVLAAIFIVIIVIRVKWNPALAPKSEEYPLREKIASIVGLFPVGLIFLLVVGGILGGYFTPGEGGAVGTVGGILFGLARRRLSGKGLSRAILTTVIMSGKLFLLLMGVYVLSGFFASTRIPALLAQFVAGLEMNRYIVLGVVIVLYIVLGCCMNITPMMLLTLPTIFPTIQALGFDGIWFGVITVILMECGMITPPVGMNVFTMASLVPDVPMAKIFRNVMPFFLGMLLCVLLIIIFPQIALWLPGMLF